MGSEMCIRDRYIYLLSIFLLFAEPLEAKAAWANAFKGYYQWSTFNFIIYSPSQDLTNRIAVDIEKIYEKIINDLGYAFYRINKDRIPIYIFRRRWDYIKMTGMPVWSGGHADTTEIAIFAYPQKGLIRSIIPHELTHLVFNTYMGRDCFPKLKWLSEGLAVYEQRYFAGMKINTPETKRFVQRGGYVPFKKMMAVRSVDELSPGTVDAWYLTTASLVAYLIEEKGKSGFHEFCRILKTTKNVNYALSQAYPWDFSDVNELEKRWLKFMKARRKKEVLSASQQPPLITAEFTKREVPSMFIVHMKEKKRLLQNKLYGLKDRMEKLRQTLNHLSLKMEKLSEKIKNITFKDRQVKEEGKQDAD